METKTKVGIALASGLGLLALMAAGGSDANAATAPTAGGDAQVYWYQNILAELGYGAPQNGVFDDRTAASVRAFQQSYGIPVTGQLDAATTQYLQEIAEVMLTQGYTPGQRTTPGQVYEVPAYAVNDVHDAVRAGLGGARGASERYAGGRRY